MHHFLKTAAFTLFVLSACSPSEKKEESTSPKAEKEQPVDSTEPENTMTWIDVQENVSAMNEETKYEEIVKLLGEPYEEYITPSLESEYVLFYNVPGVKGAIFWIMVDTDSKKFLYWSGETAEKIRVKKS